MLILVRLSIAYFICFFFFLKLQFSLTQTKVIFELCTTLSVGVYMCLVLMSEPIPLCIQCFFVAKVFKFGMKEPICEVWVFYDCVYPHAMCNICVATVNVILANSCQHCLQSKRILLVLFVQAKL